MLNEDNFWRRPRSTDTVRGGIRRAILRRAGWPAAVILLCAASNAVFAAGAEPSTDPQVDPAPCVAAANLSDADAIIAICGALIDNAKTAKSDRIKALFARAGAYDRKRMIDSAIADYDASLRLEATADMFNIRGELWRKKGDRPRALADFAAAIKLNRDHAAAKANHKSMAQELEQIGARIALAGKPSFDCATARRAVEKAICANPELADLDREIDAMNALVVRENAKVSSRAGRDRQREQDEFTARRNARFGTPGYDLRKAMKQRLQEIVGIDGY